MSAPAPADLTILADAIAAVLAEREELLRDTEQAIADRSTPWEVRAAYRAVVGSHRANVVALRADLECCRQGVNPYEIDGGDWRG
ncbi:hypothetical protein [Streptomyces violascens]|uniref:Uncharacterized protein n=1 Tax=Streptomyces violascens TaxID=67381 RepID=A0ABQ3QQZ8_9ACTN|nr:hypothetical protein [Streptomyces violascens]GGU52726.1 hypothetical protein GCM10010289_86090 [Streptomyces violascens]GHI39706.1 hypothetical protein Sviol_41140 [Streptomyces violascens]